MTTNTEVQQGAAVAHNKHCGCPNCCEAQQGGELPQDECSAFEAWAVSDGWHRLDAKGVIDGTVTNIPRLQFAWTVWQARAAIAQRAASVPDAGLMSKLPELRELAHSVLGNFYLGQDREKELAELLLAAAPQTTEKQ